MVEPTPGYFTDPSILRLAKAMLEPLTEGAAPETRSRLMILADGTVMPVLKQLALMRFGPWDKTLQPVWKDGNLFREQLDNVELRERHITRRVRKRTDLGFPAGTPEYMKAWRMKNPDKARAAQKRYVQKRKELLASLKDLRSSAVLRTATDRARLDAAAEGLPMDPFSALVAKLTDVIDDVLDDAGEASPSIDSKLDSNDNTT